MSWALVTGAGDRLGRAVALDLAQHGWSVVVHVKSNADGARETVARAHAFGAKAVAVAMDLAAPNAPAALIKAASAQAGEAPVALVNCAALFEHDTIATADAASFDKHMHLNALAPALLARAFADELSGGSRGAVVNFLDFKLASPYPDHFSYTLSKYALSGATELLARALAPRVRVNAVAPGYVLAAPGQSEEAYQRQHADTPLEYGPRPEDVAHAVRFLLENPALTGQTVFIDAGRRFRSFDRDMAFM